jgi:hypothetical protein
MKSRTVKASISSLFLAIAILALPVYAVTNELVGSSESHSIEKFDSTGKWTKTFASTGPWISMGIAASPVTDDVFVATITPTILRYNKSGTQFGPSGSYWSTFNIAALVGSNPIGSLLFDSSGNLYVSTIYGTSGYQVEIFKFTAAQLLTKTPAPSGPPIITTAGRGDQMAWDVFGNICIASFIAPNTVQCYDPNTSALAFDYAAEIQAAGMQPVGLAFGPNNNLTANSVFTGEILTEAVERSGPMNLLASGMIADVGWIAVDSSGMLYMPSFNNPGGRYETSPYVCYFYSCMDYDFNSDVVYKINPDTGTVTNFITTHIWGPYQMIFVPF